MAAVSANCSAMRPKNPSRTVARMLLNYIEVAEGPRNANMPGLLCLVDYDCSYLPNASSWLLLRRFMGFRRGSVYAKNLDKLLEIKSMTRF